MMRNLFKKIHLWLSIPVGLFVTIVCLTGAAMVFEEEINHLTDPQLYYVDESSITGYPLQPAELAELVDSSLPDSVAVTGVTVSDVPDHTWLVSLSKPKRAQVAVNPYTGEVVGSVERKPFFSTMLKLHRYLLVPTDHGSMSIGKLVVGISVLAMVIILLTGLVIWCPKKWSALRGRLKISFCGGWNKFWHQLHFAGGFYSFIFLLAIAVTGLTWSFTWWHDAVYSLCGEPAQTEQTASASKDSHKQAAASEAKTAAKADGTTGATTADGYTGATASCYSDSLAQSADGTTGATTADGYTGATAQNDPANLAWSEQGKGRTAAIRDYSNLSVQQEYQLPDSVKGWVYWIHTGKWGGLIVKFVYFLACLVGAALPITGYLFWFKRRRRRAPRC